MVKKYYPPAEQKQPEPKIQPVQETAEEIKLKKELHAPVAHIEKQ